jgi:hypothetical protein
VRLVLHELGGEQHLAAQRIELLLGDEALDAHLPHVELVGHAPAQGSRGLARLARGIALACALVAGRGTLVERHRQQAIARIERGALAPVVGVEVVLLGQRARRLQVRVRAGARLRLEQRGRALGARERALGLRPAVQHEVEAQRQADQRQRLDRGVRARDGLLGGLRALAQLGQLHA